MWWGFDIAVLWACFEAFGDAPLVRVIIVAYFVGMLANTLPLPGGVGGVDGGMVGALIAFGVEPELALIAVLGYRGFAFWLPIVPGAVAYLGLRRTVARWEREDAGEAADRHAVRSRCMEGFGGFFNDPDLQKRLQEMAEQMQGAQNLAWADNAIKLAVDMTVAAIDRDQRPGHARAAGPADPPGDGDRLPRGGHAGARGAPGPQLTFAAASSCLAATARPLAMTSLKERKRKMQTIAAKPIAERQRRDRDLLADRVGRDGRAGRRAGEHLRQQRLLHARAAGGERHERGDGVDAEHEQHVAHRAADVERLQQHPEREEAEAPSRRTGRATPRGSSGGGRRGSSGPGARAPRTPARAPTAARRRPARAIASTVSRNSVKRGCEAKNARSKAGSLEKSGGLGNTPWVNAKASTGTAIERSKMNSTRTRRRPPGSSSSAPRSWSGTAARRRRRGPARRC